jgi:hypothetical protein
MHGHTHAYTRTHTRAHSHGRCCHVLLGVLLVLVLCVVLIIVLWAVAVLTTEDHTSPFFTFSLLRVALGAFGVVPAQEQATRFSVVQVGGWVRRDGCVVVVGGNWQATSGGRSGRQ